MNFVKSVIVLSGVVFQLLGCSFIGFGYFGAEDIKAGQVFTISGVASLFLGIGAIISATII